MDQSLHRLLVPPLVAIVGASNIGKSTLVNALAGREASIVADVPGTTRDWVGVRAVLDGLCIDLADTPGVRVDPDELEVIAHERASEVVRRADVVLSCCDFGHAPIDRTPRGHAADASRVLVVGLRNDLGSPKQRCDITICARDGHGVPELARLIRARLVPDWALKSDVPWRFWEAGGQ